MKKILLSLAVVASGFWAQSQAVCTGISPANIVGNYDFTWADPGGGDWATPDFNIGGTSVQGELVIVDDGTPGTNAQGNPISAEGCQPLINGAAVLGKIAVIYRNTCQFGTKALNAENAGAIAVIILNRDPEVIGMAGGDDGASVTIPVVMLSSVDGLILTNEMLNGPVVMFLGNKLGLYANDIGSTSDDLLIAPYGSASSLLDNGFNLAMQMYNYGSNAQSNITVTANIDGPLGGSVYTSIVNVPTMNTGDTVYIVNGNPEAFLPFDLLGNYPPGLYTLTYTLDMGIADDSDADNVFTSTFTVNEDVISLANLDANGIPVANTYPSNTDGEYQSCMFFQDSMASSIGVQGLYFTPSTDTSLHNMLGEEVLVSAYEWNDTWTDLSDPNFSGNAFFATLDAIAFETYELGSNDEVNDAAYVPFGTPFGLVDNQRYLFCLQTFTSTISFGFDNTLDYSGNVGITLLPVAPIYTVDGTTGTWYSGGWSGANAASIGLKVFDSANLGIIETNTIGGSAYPNPATDVVTISMDASGAANVVVTDLAGKVAFNKAVTLVNGKASVNFASLEAGMYIFNVTLENGQTSQFNVVKK